MPRRARYCPAGTCFHVLNRVVARLTLFEKPSDYDAFERVLKEAWERETLPILAYAQSCNPSGRPAAAPFLPSELAGSHRPDRYIAP